MKSKLFIWVNLIIISALLTVGGVSQAADEWECSALPDGSASAAANGDELLMSFETTGAASSASARRTYDLTEYGQICISFTAEFSGVSSSLQRKLSIQNSSLMSTELINICGTSLKLFGADTGLVLDENTPVCFDIGIDKEAKRAAIWVDGEQVFCRDIASKWKNFNYSNMQVFFRNYCLAGSAALTSELKITDYFLTDKETGFASVPENGAESVDTESSGIELSYKGLKSPEVFSHENYTLTCGGEEVGFTVSRKGSKAIVVPEGGFSSESEYLLTILRIDDIFGNTESENQTVSFKTAISGYEKPQLEISADSELVYDTGAVNISAGAESAFGIESIAFYVNGQQYRVFSGSRAELSFSAEAGVYSIYAEARDSLGGYAQSETVTVTVIHNELPQISFEGIVNSGIYDASALAEIFVSARDIDGEVRELSVYINNVPQKKAAGDSLSLDLSGLEAGIYIMTVYAMDNSGFTGSQDIMFTVSRGTKVITRFESDFNNYVSEGDIAPSGMQFIMGGDAKILSSNDYGEEHGTVAVFRSEGGEVNGKTAHGSWARLNTTGTANTFSISMDINFRNKDAQFYYMLKHPSQSIVCIDVMFREGLFTLRDGGSVAYSMEYEPDKWYSINYTVDIVNHKYWFTLDGELIADGFRIGNSAHTLVDARLVLEFPSGPVPCGMAFDNMKVDYIEPLTQITSIGYDETASAAKVSPYAKKLLVNLNTKLQAETLNSASVLLFCGDEQIPYKELSYSSEDKRITIIPAEGLRSNQKYTVKLTNKVCDSSGTYLTGGLESGFFVDYADFDVYELKLTEDGGQICAEGSIINKTESPSDCYIILNIFSGSKLVNTTVKKVTAARDGHTAFKTDLLSKDAAQTAEAYVWSSLNNPVSVASEIYIKITQARMSPASKAAGSISEFQWEF
ncbi:MAG: Ig-like domain-containing protein [Clostridia bacterium]|nr:Ig-like domain-containing protein [Clostridia bacterium]